VTARPHPPLRFAAVGLDHRHIYDQVQSLTDAGGECVAYWTDDDARPIDGFVKRFPDVPRVADRRALLDDPSILLFTCAAKFDVRADLAIEAMRAGKDFMADKPGVITRDQLERVRAAQRATGRIWSVNFTERFEVRAVTRALELVRAGAIGEVFQTVGLGPHRENASTRPDWFWDKRRYGGILADIGSHQIDQFLVFTGATDAEVVHARVGNVAHPDRPHFDDTGEMALRAGKASGFVQVHWFTPDGLSTWGDGRLFVTGTEGAIELRKYVDVAGRPGIDHLFLVDRKGMHYVDCRDAGLPYYANLVRDVFERTETAMPQAHAYKVCELALEAQSMADAAAR
jgi:predicted dehydrogenase